MARKAEEAARKAREEAERKRLEEIARKAREEAARKAREEAAKRAREEAARVLRERINQLQGEVDMAQLEKDEATRIREEAGTDAFKARQNADKQVELSNDTNVRSKAIADANTATRREEEARRNEIQKITVLLQTAQRLAALKKSADANKKVRDLSVELAQRRNADFRMKRDEQAKTRIRVTKHNKKSRAEDLYRKQRKVALKRECQKRTKNGVVLGKNYAIFGENNNVKDTQLGKYGLFKIKVSYDKYRRLGLKREIDSSTYKTEILARSNVRAPWKVTNSYSGIFRVVRNGLFSITYTQVGKNRRTGKRFYRARAKLLAKFANNKQCYMAMNDDGRFFFFQKDNKKMYNILTEQWENEPYKCETV